MIRARFTQLTMPLSIPAALVLAWLMTGAAQAQTITKCQDAEGNWHYGDFAAEACAKESTVTEIDERGLKVKESEAPPTQEEIEAQKAAKAQEQREAERRARQQAEDRRLLQTYDSPQAIINARDERVAALERELDSHQLFRQDLVDEKDAVRNDGNDERVGELDRQIEQYDQAIERLKRERREVVQEYNRELERYRKLVGQ